MPLPYISPDLVQTYQEEIAKKQSPSTSKRKMASLKRFFDWATNEGHLEENPLRQASQIQEIREMPEAVVSQTESRSFNLGNLFKLGILIGLVILIFLLATKLQLPIPFRLAPASQTEIPKGTAVVTPKPSQEGIAVLSPWTIFAKMNLKDQTGNTIKEPQNITFKLYSAEKENGNPPVWTSSPQNITPDSNGDTYISLDSVPTEVFFKNERLFLAPTLNENEITERIPVSTANVASSLQGYYPATEAGPLTIPVINTDGSLILASQSPAVKAKAGNLLISGQAVTIATPTGSDGNITLSPDGKGTANFIFQGAAGNLLNAQDANLTSGSLYYGAVRNNSGGYNLITLQSGSTPTTKFSVDASGNTTVAGNLNLTSGNLQIAGVTRLNNLGRLSSITGYYQDSGLFQIDQGAADNAKITKTLTSSSGVSSADLLTLLLDESSLTTGSGSDTLVLKRLGGTSDATALYVANGNAKFDEQVQMGRYSSNPTAIGQGSIVFNTTDTTAYVWNGSSWVALGGGAVSGFWSRDSTNGFLYPSVLADKVGIGTTAPGAKLEVAGQVKITGGTPGTNKVLTSDANGLASWETVTGAGGIGGGGTLNYVAKFTPDGSNIGNSSIFDDGNVGIGTTSPEYKLHVEGGSADSRTAIFKSSYASGTSFISIRDVNTTFDSVRVGAITNQLVLWAGNSERVRIDQGGNVGIGTTAPAQKLDVVGNLQFSQALMPNGQAGTSGYVLTSAGANTAPTWTDPGGLAVRWNALTNPNGNLSLSMGTYTTQFSWTGGGIFAFDTNGNVGIGTTAPAAKLQVTGGSVIPLRVDGSGQTNSSISIVPSSVGNGIGFTTSAVLQWTNGTNAIGYIRATDASGYLRFDTGGSNEKMRIDSGGNVGIGTTAPAQKLDIVGNLQFSQALMPNGQAGTSGYVLTSAGAGTAPTWTNPAGLAVKWNALQNPDGNLSLVMGTNTTVFNWATGTSTDNLFSFTTDASANGTGALVNIQSGASSTLLPLRVRAGATEAITVNSSGNVGIGTTNPGSKLEVNGRIAQAGSTAITGYLMTNSGQLASSTNLNPGILVYGGDGSTNTYGMDLGYNGRYLTRFLTGGSTNGFVFGYAGSNPANQSAWTELVRINGDGNVGIGITAPTSKLYVSGGISTFNQNLTSQQWSTNVVIPINATNYNDLEASPNRSMRFLGYTSGTGGYGGGISWGMSPQSDNTWKSGTYSTGQFLLAYDGASLKLQGSNQNPGATPTTFSPSDFLTVLNSGNVGVGTTAPAQKLDVVGNLQFSQALMPNGQAGTSGYVLTSAGAGTAPTWTDPGGLAVRWNALTNPNGNLSLSMGTYTTQFSWTGGGIFAFDTNGNVGIGTTAPNYQLQVHSSGANGIQVTNASTGSTVNDGLLLYVDASGNARVQNTESTNLSLWTGNSQRVTVQADGNVGIGTTAPATKLDVSGTNTQLRLTYTPASVYTDLKTSSSGYLQLDATGYLYEFGANLSNTTNVGRFYNSTHNVYLDIGFNGSPRIDSVGSGLSINYLGDQNVTFFSGSESGDNRILSLYGYDTGAVAVKYGRMWVGTNGKFNLEAQSGEDFGILTGGSEKFTILNSGNVGIGTTAPASLVDVKASAPTVTSVVFYGTGLDDLSRSGTYTNSSPANYAIVIDGTGTPDTFKWSDNGGGTWNATLVAITGSAQSLNNGISVTFTATTGHTLNDTWGFSAFSTKTFTATNTGQGSLGATASNNSLLYLNGPGSLSEGILSLYASGKYASGALAKIGPYSYMSTNSSGKTFWGFGANYDGSINQFIRRYTGQASYLPYISVFTNSIAIGGAASNLTTDTNPTLSDQFTFELSNGSLGVGDAGPDAKVEILSTTEQLRLTQTDGTTDARFTVSSTGDLTIDMLGSGTTDQLVLGDTDTINVGSGTASDIAYNKIGDAADVPEEGAIAADNDLYIGGDLEVDGVIYGSVAGSAGSVKWNALTTPDGSLSLVMGTNTTAFNWATGTSTNNLFSLTSDASANGTGALLNVQTGASSTLLPLRVRAGSTESLTINDSGNVGIGTTAPVQKLQVAGSAKINNHLAVGGGLSDVSTTAQIISSEAFATTGATNIFGAQVYQFSAPTSAALTGINTALQGQALVYSGATQNVSTLRGVWGYVANQSTAATTVTDATALYASAPAESGGGTIDKYYGLYIENPTAANTNYSIYSAGGTNYFAGNVGVGTTAPAQKLDVAGNLQFSQALMPNGQAGTSGYILVSQGANTAPIWSTTLPSGTTLPFDKITSGTNTVAAMIVDTGASLTYANSGTINASSLIGATWAAPGTIGSGTPNTGAFTSLSSSSTTTLASGVGTNTTIGNASGTFQVTSAGLNVTTAGALSGVTTLSMNNQLTNSYANSAALNLTGNGSGITFTGTGPNQIITAASQNLALMPGGNVGIGTTAPSTLLELGKAGTMGTLGLAGSTSGLVTITPAAIAGTWTMTLPTDDGTSGYLLKTDGAGVTSWIAPGSVGSAWSSLAGPGANLSMTMAAYTTTFTWNDATGAGVNLFTMTDTLNNTGTGYLLNLATATGSTLKPFHVSAVGTEALMVDATGQVGIGTTGPNNKLEVLSTTSPQLRVAYDTTNYLTTAVSLAGAATLTAAGSSPSLNLQPDGSVDVNIAGGSGGTGCTITNSSGNLSCSGNITGASAGTVGYWSRSGTTLSPATANDIVSISSNTAGSAVLALTASAIATNSTSVFTNTVTIAGSGISSTYYGQKLAITNNQTANADTLYGQHISFTDAGNLANTITGLYVDTSTANANDIAYAGIFMGGNVGIGTTAPEDLLEIQGTEGIDAILTLDADDGDDTTDTWEIRSEATGNDLSIRNNDIEVFNLTTAGALQIDSNLDVDGTTNDIAGTLNLSGGALTSTGALTVTPQAGNNLNIALSTTGDLAVNTDDLYIDTSEAMIGIGTTTPSQMLDISSTAPSFQMTDTTASAKSLRLVTDANFANFYEAAGSAGDILSLDLANKRVGIGTTAPTGRLDIVGSQNFSAMTAPGALTAGTPTAGGSCTAGTHSYKVTFTSAGAGETTGGTASSQITCVLTTGQTVPLSAIPTGPAGTTGRKIYRTVAGDTGNYLLVTTIADNTTTTYSDTTDDGLLGAAAPVSNTTAVANIQTGGTTKMVIDSSGNVGINAGTLQIGNAANVAYNRIGTIATANGLNAATDLFIEGKLEFNGALFLNGGNISNSVGTATIQFCITAACSSTSQILNTLAGGSWLIENPASGNVGQAALMVNQAMVDRDIFTASAAGTPKFTITHAGNVGIGITAPAYLLDVRASNQTGAGFGIITAAGQINGTSTTNYGILANPTAATTNDYLIADYARVDTVASAITLSNAYGMYIENPSKGAGSTITNNYGIYINSQTSGSTNYAIYSAGGTNYFGGNVGIGTTAPGAVLTVASNDSKDEVHIGDSVWTSNDSTTRLNLGNTNGNSILRLGQSSTALGSIAWVYDATENNTYLKIQSAPTTNKGLVLQSDGGNVGIGTTAPGYKLDVNGTGTASLLKLTNSTGIAIADIYSGATYDAYLSLHGSGTNDFRVVSGGGALCASGQFCITNVASVRMLIDSSGNVGIGTTAPGQKLDVVGKIQLSDLTAPGSDPMCWDGSGTSTIGDCSSLRKYKENIQDLTLGLNTILNLEPKTFYWRQTDPNNPKNPYQDLGFIAEDVEIVNPLLTTHRDGELTGVRYEKLTAVLVNAVKDQQSQISSLATQVGATTLTSTGDLNIEINTNATNTTNKYQLTNNDAIVNQIGAFAELIVANLRVGAIEASELVTQSLEASVGKIGQLSSNLLTANQLISPVIETNVISPVPGEKNIKIAIGDKKQETSGGKLIVENASGSAVASIDETGNATFEGTVDSQQLTVNSNATVEGELHANKIVSSQIDQLTNQLVNQSTSLEEIQALLREAETNQSLLTQAGSWNVNTATGSASLTNQLINQLTVNDLFVTGTSAMTSLSLSRSLTMGTDLIFSSEIDQLTNQPVNSINSLSAPLSLQSLALAPVEIMAGKFRVETNGDVKIQGNLAVAGNVDIGGNLTASGSAQFKEVSADKFVIANSQPIATDSGRLTTDVQTNATAGKAVITAGLSDITINNSNVNDNTLVYVTPTSTTLNNVLYVKSKGNGSFTVGFENPISVDVSFNWWVIETR